MCAMVGVWYEGNLWRQLFLSWKDIPRVLFVFGCIVSYITWMQLWEVLFTASYRFNLQRNTKRLFNQDEKLWIFIQFEIVSNTIWRFFILTNRRVQAKRGHAGKNRLIFKTCLKAKIKKKIRKNFSKILLYEWKYADFIRVLTCRWHFCRYVIE